MGLKALEVLERHTPTNRRYGASTGVRRGPSAGAAAETLRACHGASERGRGQAANAADGIFWLRLLHSAPPGDGRWITHERLLDNVILTEVRATSGGVSYDPSSRSRLTRHDLPRFGDGTLFHRIARALCEAECLPRKELFESWEVARRARRRFRGGRVLDLACGHALVAHLMLVLDDTSPSAIGVDRRIPESAAKAGARLCRDWPRLTGRVTLEEGRLDRVEVRPDDVVVSCHACGGLTDTVLDVAIAARARVVVLPCCQATGKNDLGGLGGWLDPALAIDVTRAARLRAAGYIVSAQTIPASITTKNRLLMKTPRQA